MHHGVTNLLTMVIGKYTHKRFNCWRDKGLWEKLLHLVMDELDFEWLIDASHCKVRPHATDAKGANQDMSHIKADSIQRYIWL